jgi:hypothetical protein
MGIYALEAVKVAQTAEQQKCVMPVCELVVIVRVQIRVRSRVGRGEGCAADATAQNSAQPRAHVVECEGNVDVTHA